MPLHLLGKKSWNVYSPANIARVKADEAAAAAREAAEEQRIQELDAARRAAILRDQTPPPLPEAVTARDRGESRPSEKSSAVHGRKRRRLPGEDDTDRDIRLARAATGSNDEDHVAVMRLRKPTSDAPWMDHAGHINLFPVDLTEAMKREKHAEAETEKNKSQEVFAAQYTMRLSNATGKSGSDRPWYTSGTDTQSMARKSEDKLIGYPGFESKDVWGNEDPGRKDREQQRIAANDPLVFMNKGLAQLKRYKEGRKKWNEERERELREMRAAEEQERKKDRHRKRKTQDEAEHVGDLLERGRSPKREHRHRHRHRHRRHRHNQSRSRSPSREGQGERRHHRHRHERRHDDRKDRSDRHERERYRERDRERESKGEVHRNRSSHRELERHGRH